ncbi:MAG: hypothetical protein IT376_04790 [Polyangiaceae bacterium]|nr:hypothetical protein [Polyangiaceae bacterium]
MAGAAPPLLERLGVRYLRWRASGVAAAQAPASDEVHVLNVEERRALRRIERTAIGRAALAGALSGLACAIPVLLLPEPPGGDTAGLVRYWAIVGGVMAVASVAEIGFLYWDALRAVHELAVAAGLRVRDEPHGEDAAMVVAALARAALELPNPPNDGLGVDPTRETSRWKVLAASLLYKLKVALTGFVLKAILRRALGRVVVRSWLELVAVPVTAAWNAAVCWIVLREARLRAMGPSAAIELARVLFADGLRLTESGRAAVLRAIGGSIVRTGDLHPNLTALLRAARARVGDAPVEALDDTRRFLDELPRLPAAEQALVLRVTAVAAILDGKLAPAERRLLGEAFTACGRPFEVRRVERLRRAFLRGEPLDPALVTALAGVEPVPT